MRTIEKNTLENAHNVVKANNELSDQASKQINELKFMIADTTSQEAIDSLQLDITLLTNVVITCKRTNDSMNILISQVENRQAQKSQA